MTLNQLIKSKLSDDSWLGDLARDIQGDEQFPANGSDQEIFSYIRLRTAIQGNHDIVEKLMTEYNRKHQMTVSPTDLDASFGVLRSETWSYYKEYFIVDKVIMVGTPNDFYKVFCIDSSTHQALYFDIKSGNSLNDIRIENEADIFMGDLTRTVSIKEACELLERCEYPIDAPPNDNTLKELLSFLKKHIPE